MSHPFSSQAMLPGCTAQHGPLVLVVTWQSVMNAAKGECSAVDSSPSAVFRNRRPRAATRRSSANSDEHLGKFLAAISQAYVGCFFYPLSSSSPVASEKILPICARGETHYTTSSFVLPSAGIPLIALIACQQIVCRAAWCLVWPDKTPHCSRVDYSIVQIAWNFDRRSLEQRLCVKQC